MVVLAEILIVCACVAGAAFYSGIETGVISIRRLRLRHRLRQGEPAARELAYFVQEPDRLLGTTLVGTNLCIVSASVAAARAATSLMGAQGKVVSSVLTAVVLVVFGEYLPKAWFRARPYVRSARFVRPLHWSWLVFRPVSVGLTWMAGLILPEKGTRKDDLCELATRGELKLLAQEAEQHGVLTPEERGMIHRAVELSEKPSSAVMTPKEKIVSVDAEASVSQFLKLARKEQFTRFPIHDSTLGRLTGVVNIFDVFAAGPDGPEGLSTVAREPLLIRADMPVDEIIPALRHARESLALVVDEEKEVIGLVTAEDVLRQVVS